VAFFNYVTKEITLKVVYYGPGLSGKTTNLQHLYSILEPSSRGKFISLATESDRTLFFDFLPVELGKIKDFSLRFQLYTVPGQIRYNATRKLVLKGADAIVFVADSQRDMREQNLESYANMRENLTSNNLDPDEIPVVMQYNKRDLPNTLSLEELDGDLNKKGYPSLEAVAVDGTGVQETFRLITKLLLKDISRKHKVDITSPKEEPISLKVPEKEQFEIVDAVVTEEPVRPVIKERPVPPVRPPLPPPVTPFPAEKLNAMATDLHNIQQSLAVIRESLSTLFSEVRESKRQQAEMIKMMKELNNSLTQVRRKKRWFHFNSR
jgi:signal recognition particle receptor subunit beta